MRRVVLCVASAALLVAGCSGDDDIDPVDAVETDDDVDQPEQDEPEPEPEEADDDPFAVPDEIDEDYLQRVADEIMAIRTDILRDTVEANPETDRLSEDIRLRLDSIYSGRALVLALESFQDVVRATNIEDALYPPEEMSDQRLLVDDVLQHEEGCVTALSRFDYSGTAREPSEVDELYLVVLKRAERAGNPTGWVLYENEGLINLEDEEPLVRGDFDDLTLEDLDGIVDSDCRTDER